MLKYCAFFSLWAGIGLGADYMNFQAARAVIGQKTFTAQNFGASDTALGSVGGLAVAGDTLFVADSNRLGFLPINNRVLLFNNISKAIPQSTAVIPNLTRCPLCLGQASVVLGQPDFTTTTYTITRTGMRQATAVASDGHILVVADTANNRVLIWNSIPTSNGQPADLVLGQADFTTIGPVVTTATTFRGPQGVWIQNGKLFVADTQNNRVMIWNTIPTKNNQPADMLLGQSSFTAAPVQDITQSNITAAANTLLTPVSVSSDGTHLFVTDLGFNRVLIWNSIPTQNQQPADVVVGQPGMTQSIANYGFTQDSSGVETPVLCTVSNGTDSNSKPTYPARCGATLDFPRFALSDGKRLYIADAGNDRVMIFNTIPTQNGAKADLFLGQPDEFADIESSNNDFSDNPNGPNLLQSASNVTPTPTSLAWDGTNLYVADPNDFRVLVFTPADAGVPTNGVRNAASVQIFATDTIILGGAINAGDTVTAIVCGPVNGAVVSACDSTTGASYTYTVVKDDTFDTVIKGLATLINAGAGDPNVFAQPSLGLQLITLVARVGGADGNTVSLSATLSTGAQLTLIATNTHLSGGTTPTTIAPGSLITILGTNLAETIAVSNPNVKVLPFELGNVQVYADGIQLGLMYVSPTQINAAMPFEVQDATSVSLYVRIRHDDGSVSTTIPVAVPIDLQNPGLFADQGQEPRPALAFHASSYATGLVSIDGGIHADDTATITIADRNYTYTVLSTDTGASIRDGLIALINASPEEVVTASVAPTPTRLLLRAKVPGPEGNDIPIAGSSKAPAGSAATVVPFIQITPTTTTLCCANRGGSRVTQDNPAVAGETIIFYGTGLGLVGPTEAHDAINDSHVYLGTPLNNPNSFVFALIGGQGANVVGAGLLVGGISVYQVILQISPAAPTNAYSQVTISQDIYTSNIVTIPVVNTATVIAPQ